MHDLIPILTLDTPVTYYPFMDQLFLCAFCGEENEITIDPTEGEQQELIQDCAVCCRPNLIRARFNYYTNEFDLSVTQESEG